MSRHKWITAKSLIKLIFQTSCLCMIYLASFNLFPLIKTFNNTLFPLIIADASCFMSHYPDFSHIRCLFIWHFEAVSMEDEICARWWCAVRFLPLDKGHWYDQGLCVSSCLCTHDLRHWRSELYGNPSHLCFPRANSAHLSGHER